MDSEPHDAKYRSNSSSVMSLVIENAGESSILKVDYGVWFSIRGCCNIGRVQVLLYGDGRCVARMIIPVFRFAEVQIEESKGRGGLRIVGEGRRTKGLTTRASTALYTALPKDDNIRNGEAADGAH